MYILLLEACPPHGLPWFKKTLVIQTSEMSPHSLHVHICTHCSFWEGSYLQYVFSVNVCRLSAMRCYMVLCWLLSTVELQTASSLHRDPAPSAQHGQRLLEAGAGLPLHLYSDAQWRRPSTGKRGQSSMPTFTIPSNTDLPDLEVYKNICLSFNKVHEDNGFGQLPKVQGPYPPIERRTDQCMVR